MPKKKKLPAAKTKAAKAKAAKAKLAKKWHLYVLLCKDGTLYCGITNDLERRISQHNAGKGARYTRGRGPVSLRRSWPQKNKSAALRAEYSFKKLSRPCKEMYLAA
ncbi:GIY-YIG nuclease family protein [Prosthecobacter sp.]|uniref:GIY-YIG nuclease family protein n=1 Tax=Prosthecobacter sp. TaxID=1965333 RepID=UPI002487DF07|nr:GIY-YIG nuclease family protein [Prosthecobacter sp.]MDI1312312.1 GIY-YIG nuclease family protein [Prosthecobacter sp.]